MDKKEFKLNDNISLRLEEGKTNIYIKGGLFRQCKYLLMNQIKGTDVFDYQEQVKEIIVRASETSIDDQAEGLDKSHYEKTDTIFISPEEEFWAHCSNLQVWVEQDYDTRLLHSNLAFPLLEVLSEIGDPIAKRKVKEEIAIRFNEGTNNTKFYLVDSGYIYKFLNVEERSTLDLKGAILDKYNDCSTFEEQNELDAEGHLENITREDIIENCLNPRERSALLEIIAHLEEDFEYDWILTMDCDKYRVQRDEKKYLRFFEVLNGHVSALELDLYRKTATIWPKLRDFEKLDYLYLNLHDNFRGLEHIELNLIESLSI